MKLPAGIQRTAAGGFRAFLRVRPFPVVAKTFPADTPIQEIQDWRTDEREKLEARRPPRTARGRALSGTLAADVEAYLEKKRLLESIKSLRSEMRAWIELYPTIRTHALTADHVERGRQTWASLTPPYAKRTIDHRVRALRGFFHTMFGKRRPTPADDIAPLVSRNHIGHPRRIDPTVIQKVARNLNKRGDRLTLARFMVLTATGRRPSELARAVATDLDVSERVWYVRTGKGGDPTPYPLGKDGLAAFKVFCAVDGFAANARFDVSDYARSLYEAEWPQDWDTSTRRRRNRLRPYQARHSVAITLGTHGTPLDQISETIGHERQDTTKQIYMGVIPARLRSVADTLDRVRPLDYARIAKQKFKKAPVVAIDAIPRGIVKLATAYRASVRVRPYNPVFRHFPLETPIATIQTWRRDERAKLLTLKARAHAKGA